MLIEKYKRLIFSIPIKYGFSRDDAADIFQGVCLALLENLSKLRDPRALPAWLMQVTSHECLHWKRRQRRFADGDRGEQGRGVVSEGESQAPEDLLAEIEKEQMLRDALSRLTTRCRRLVEMLFYETPRRSYREVASELGLAVGSIGLTRRLCLDKLRQALMAKGFR